MARPPQDWRGYVVPEKDRRRLFQANVATKARAHCIDINIPLPWRAVRKRCESSPSLKWTECARQRNKYPCGQHQCAGLDMRLAATVCLRNIIDDGRLLHQSRL